MNQKHYNELLKIAADLETQGDGAIAKALRAAIAGDAGEPSMADAYVGAREDLAIWKRRALEAESKLREQSATQPDPQATSEAIAARFLKDEDFSALFTFHSQCQDSECDGYTERAETMARLAELGVVQRLIGGRGKRYGMTAFGAWLVDASFHQDPSRPLRTVAEHNDREAAGHTLYLKESAPQSTAWVQLDRNTRESWRRKAMSDRTAPQEPA